MLIGAAFVIAGQSREFSGPNLLPDLFFFFTYIVLAQTDFKRYANKTILISGQNAQVTVTL